MPVKLPGSRRSVSCLRAIKAGFLDHSSAQGPNPGASAAKISRSLIAAIAAGSRRAHSSSSANATMIAATLRAVLLGLSDFILLYWRGT